MNYHRSLASLSLIIALGLAGPIAPAMPQPIAPEASSAQPSATLEAAIAEGDRLLKAGSRDSLLAAIQQFERALQLSQVEGQKAKQALALGYLGYIYDSLGEKPKALAYFNQALPLYRAVGDRGGEANTLNNIGAVYSALGEKQKALEYYNQALPLYRAVGDRGGEANTLNNIGAVYSALGEKQKALEYYNQALPLYRAVGDRGGEATTLNNIGAVYDDLGEKPKALDYYNQALPLSRAVGDRRGEAATLNGIGLVYDSLGEKPKALAYFNQALPLYRAVGDRGGEANTLNNIGGVYSELGEKPKALDYYSQALPLFRAVGDRGGEAATLNNIGGVYSELGEKPKALDYYSQALPLFRAVGDRGSEAATLNNIGAVYDDLGEKPKALDYYNQALPLYRAVGNRGGEATTLNNIGGVYSSLGEKQKALDYYNQALPLYRAVGNRGGEATTLNNIGGVYSSLGEKQKALDYYNQALPLYRAVGDRGGEATTLNNIGSVYDSLGEKPKALDYYNQALPLFRAVGDRRGEAAILNNIGAVYDDLGEKPKALDYYNQALPLDRAVGDRGGEAATLNNIGSVYDSLGEKPKALDYYNQALPLSRAVGDRAGEATTLNNIGQVYSELGEKQKALAFYNQSLPLKRAVGDRSGEAVTLYNIASTYRSQNRHPEALTQINTAINLIEQLRSALKDDQLKTSYFATVQVYYQFKIDLLMQLHQQNPSKGYDAQALETSDQSRARVLRDLLTEARTNITQNISPALKQREDDLIQKLNTREKQLIELSGKPGTDKVIETLKTEIQQLLQQQQTLKAEIRQTNPAYANLQYPKPITLVEIQQQLDPDILILQYQLGKDQSYLWVIGKTSLNSYLLPKQADLEKTITAFRDSLQDRTSLSRAGIRVVGNKSIPPLAPAAIALSQQILAPAATQLTNKRLVIIPDGALHTIPFAALAQPNDGRTNDTVRTNGGSSLPPYRPLLETHPISYLPSASTIAILRSTPLKPAPKTLAVLADPVFGKDDDRFKPTTPKTRELDVVEQIARDRAARSFTLNRLPGTRTEANDLLKLTAKDDSTSAFGFEANDDWITKAPLNQYRYVHLATHGFVDGDRPELSSIILSAFDSKGQPRKAFLRLPDLFNLNLSAKMVTLSACQTGLGSQQPGEGLVGMTRGLMYAGTERVTVSLWNVPDTETAQLMTQFYQNLWTGKVNHVEGLRSAQLQMWKTGKHPYFWAAFGLQGEWRN